MSGTKSVTVSTSEYQRLQNAANRLRSVQQDLPTLINNARRQALEELEQRLVPLEERQEEFMEWAANFEDDLSQLEQESARQLQEQGRKFRQALQDQDYHLQSLIADEQSARKRADELLGSRIIEERNLRQVQFDRLDKRIQSIELRDMQIAERATCLLRDANSLSEFIQEHYRHTFFAPGQLVEITTQIHEAHDSLTIGASQTGLGKAQDSYRRLSKLRLELEEQECQWAIALETARQKARMLVLLAGGHKRCAVQNDQHEEDSFEIDADYWSHGGMTALQNEASAIVGQLDTEQPQIGTEELRQVTDVLVPNMRERLNIELDEARAEFFSAQLRVEIAHRMLPILQNGAYDPDGRVYVGDDERNGLAFKMADRWDNAVVITIQPVTGRPDENEIQILSYDRDETLITDDEREKRAEALAASLRESGLPVGNVQKTSDEPDPKMKNLNNIITTSATPAKLPVAEQVVR